MKRTPNTPPRRASVPIFAIDGQIRGLELFDSDTAFAKLMTKLVGSYAKDAIEVPAQGAEAISQQALNTFLQTVGEATSEGFPAVGKGLDLRLSGPGIAGGALVADQRVIHLSAFSVAA